MMVIAIFCFRSIIIEITETTWGICGAITNNNHVIALKTDTFSLYNHVLTHYNSVIIIYSHTRVQLYIIQSCTDALYTIL